MREDDVRGRTTVGALLGALLVASGCSTDRELTEPEPEPLTQESLAAAGLTSADLPDDFAEPTEASIATDVVAEHACDDALLELDPALEHSVAFVGADATLTSSVAHFPGQGGALGQLLVDISESCSQVVVQASGLAVRTGGLDFGVLTDDTTALRIELEPTAGPILERDLVLIQRGDLVHLIRLDGPRPSDKALLDRVVRVAIDRLGGLHDSTT